jgi:hypothetical protein
MPLSAASALAAVDPANPITIEQAKRVFAHHGFDAPSMLEHADRALIPIQRSRDDSGWLLDRLDRLWKSTVPAQSLTAEAWLNETGRMLQSLPRDIVADAIDRHIEGGKGFTPTAGEILAIANPLHLRRKAQRLALKLMVHGLDPQPVYPWDRNREREIPADELCTAEEAKEILANCGFKPKSIDDLAPRERGQRVPTVEDYVKMGLSREQAEQALGGTGE